MSADLKAIETRWHGLRFRSRLEARWAVFLSRVGLTFDYEPEGYDLNGTLYLPDFWVHPRQSSSEPDYEAVPGYWLEVKGPPFRAGDETWNKAALLAEKSGRDVCLFGGQLRPRHVGFRFKPDGTLRGVRFFACPFCDVVEPVREVEHLSCCCVAVLASESSVAVALREAMGARFEHGESPA